VTIRAKLRVRRGTFDLEADFTAPGRGVSALFGPSGCGKTTLLRAIAGLEADCSGLLSVGDETWQDDDARLPAHGRSLGYVFQEPSLFDHLDVRRNLEYGIKRVAKDLQRIRLPEATELLGIGPFLDRRPASLSGGERQRVAIARALLTSPRLLLLDEPLAALDRDSKKEILPYLERVRAELEIPVLYVSHATDEVAQFADHMILMEHGRVIGSGGIFDMLTRLDLPLARGPDAEAVVEATVTGHDGDFGLTYLAFPGGRFTVVDGGLERGRLVRLRVLARDVSLTLERQTGTSILNICPATVTGLADDRRGRVVVQLDLGGTTLLAQITRKSAAALGLDAGQQVYAQVKTVAVVS